MENPDLGIFYSDSNQIIYKQIFNVSEASELNEKYLKSNLWSDGAKVIATGIRPFFDVNLEEEDIISERLQVVLRDYFPDLLLDRYARFYNHQLGEVKPHKDKCHDGVSNYTILIYLTDDFDDGKLHIKNKKTKYVINPKKGHGIIFNKDLLHWAGPVYEGTKNFLLIHAKSAF